MVYIQFYQHWLLLAFVSSEVVVKTVSALNTILSHNPRMDVAILLDSNPHMKYVTKYQQVLDDIKAWAAGYLRRKKNETRFSVTHCLSTKDRYDSSGIPKPDLLFKNGDNEEAVNRSLFIHLDIDGSFNTEALSRCLLKQKMEVFDSHNGHRSNVTNVILYFNDCVKIDEELGSYILSVIKKFAIFLCICIPSSYGPENYRRWLNETERLLIWLDNDQSKLIVYHEVEYFRKRLDGTLPLVDLEIEHCAYTNLSTLCQHNPKTHKCEKQNWFIIEQYPYPPDSDLVKKCPVNETLECPKEKCEIRKMTTMTPKATTTAEAQKPINSETSSKSTIIIVILGVACVVMFMFLVVLLIVIIACRPQKIVRSEKSPGLEKRARRQKRSASIKRRNSSKSVPEVETTLGKPCRLASIESSTSSWDTSQKSAEQQTKNPNRDRSIDKCQPNKYELK